MGIESLLPMGISLLGALGKGAAGGGGGGQQQPAAAAPQLPPLPPSPRLPMPMNAGMLDQMQGGNSPSMLDMTGPMGGGGMGIHPNDLLSLLSGGFNGR